VNVIVTLLGLFKGAIDLINLAVFIFNCCVRNDHLQLESNLILVCYENVFKDVRFSTSENTELFSALPHLFYIAFKGEEFLPMLQALVSPSILPQPVRDPDRIRIRIAYGSGSDPGPVQALMDP
jgi:hypothetical protein